MITEARKVLHKYGPQVGTRLLARLGIPLAVVYAARFGKEPKWP